MNILQKMIFTEEEETGFEKRTGHYVLKNEEGAEFRSLQRERIEILRKQGTNPGETGPE